MRADEIVNEWLGFQAGCLNLIIVIIALLYLVLIIEFLIRIRTT
ncbi:MAG: hypothetical protein QXR81_08085 [Candidatus Nezhaarchaeales archaeon]